MATYRNPQTGEVLTEEQFKQRFGGAPLTKKPKAVEPSKQPLNERLSSSLEQTGNRIAGNLEGTGTYAGQSPLRRGVDATAATFTGALDAGGELLPEPARNALDWVGKKAGEGFNWATDKLSNTQLLKDIGDLEAEGYINEKDNPIYYAMKESLGTAGSAGELAGDITAFDLGLKAPNAAKPIAGAAADTFKGAGRGAYRMTIVPEEGTRMALQKYQAAQPTLTGRVKNLLTGESPDVPIKPVTEADTAARHGLAGTEWMLGVQAKRVSTKLWDDIIDPALSEVRGKVNMDDFFTKVRTKIMNETKEPNLRASRLEALDDLRADYTSGQKVDLKGLQEFKEGWAEKVPESAYKGKIPGSNLNYVRDIAAGEARNIIYRYAGDKARQAYIDYGNLQSIMKAGIKSIGDPAKKSLGRNVWEFLMDQAVTPVATVGGLILYRTGQGLEFISGRGAKKVKDIVGPNDIPTKVPVQALPSDFTNEIPTIQMGRKAPKPESGLPEIEY